MERPQSETRDPRTVDEAIVFAERLADAAFAALADAQPIAAILHGSLVSGDYVPGRSDVDVLVIVERALTDAELEVLPRTLPGPADGALPFDLRVVTGEVAVAPTDRPSLEFSLGRRPGTPDEIAVRVDGEPDLLIEFRVARTGRCLRGPRTATLIGPIPSTWVLDHGRRTITRWHGLVDDDENTEFMVLTACRIWRFAVTGEIASKGAAAAWVLERAPTLRAIPAAIRRRRGELGVEIAERDVGEVLAAALDATTVAAPR